MYLLRYTRDVLLAVVEAKVAYKLSGDGLQQAKDYAEILGLRLAYSTNGHGIVEFDYLSGQERYLDAFPTPDELWNRLSAAQGLSESDRARHSSPRRTTRAAKARATTRRSRSTARSRRS